MDSLLLTIAETAALLRCSRDKIRHQMRASAISSRYIALEKPPGFQGHTTMNIYGDAATADIREAHSKIVQLALQTV